jgi:dihydrodipicolinate synthase/N-acetylneuraminate lyase
VFPAVTTKFAEDLSLDEGWNRRHIRAQLEAGVDGIILSGSLGEASTLSSRDKVELIRMAADEVGGAVPVLCGVAERSTDDACRFVEDAAAAGADGFMLLPPMLYKSDPRETVTYLLTVAGVTARPIMLYNNPVSYGVDVTPEMLEDLADEPRFVAIKESSDDVRRVTDILNRVGDRYRIFCGVDNIALEAMVLGAVGWVAGLVCAFPRETVAIYKLVEAGRIQQAVAIYRWFMPLLHLDVSTKLVQNIKLAEAKTGLGTEVVRPPRLPLAGEERARVEAIVDAALASRPELPEV